MTTNPASTPPASIDSVIDRIGLGRFQWRLLTVGGITWAVDAMEVLIGGFILPGVTAHFGFERVSLPSTVFLSAAFLGMLIGALVWGPVADRIGRRRVLLITVLLTLLFGVAAAFAPNYETLVALRFLTGFAIGGTLPVDYALIAELVPTHVRGRFLVLLESFWAVGTVGVALLSWWAFTAFEPTEAWRWVLGLAALPALLSLWLRRSIPESPRFLAARGQAGEARAVLARVAQVNGRPADIPPLATTAHTRSAPLADIWRGSLLRRTVLLSVIWFSLSLGYYGIFVWLPSFFRASGLDLGLVYRNTLILALAQIPGYALAAYLVERWGRRPTLAAFLAGSAAASFLFALVTGQAGVLLASSLLSFMLLGAWGALYAFTPELYPTGVRSTGMGWASSTARLAGLLAPSLGALLLVTSLPLALAVYAAFFLLAAACTLLIVTETRGRDLT